MFHNEKNIDFDSYIINKDGTIFSKYWKREMKGYRTKKGYLYYNFKLKDGRNIGFLGHRVIWVYFNGEIPEGLEIDHIIPVSVGGTNELSNLRLVTHPENMNNPISREKQLSAMTSDEYKSKMSEIVSKRYEDAEYKEKIRKSVIERNKNTQDVKKKKVGQYTLDGKLVKIWDSATDVERDTNGLFNQTGICYCCNGGHFDKKRGKWKNCLKYKGFIWKYV